MRLALAILGTWWAVGPAWGQTRVERRMPLSPDSYVRVMNRSGSVRVIGWEKDSLAVTGRVRDDVEFYLGGGGSSAKLAVWSEEAVPESAELEVRVPSRSTVWVKTEESSIEVTGVEGIDAYSVTGRIEIVGEVRQLYAESMGGDLALSASGASIRAKSAGGSITYRGSAVELDLSTVSGDISVIAPPVDRGRFESLTGTIWFEGGVERGGSLDFHTHDGMIELRLPSEISADFDITSVRGKVRNEVGGDPDMAWRELDGRELSFVAGRGGARISVQTFGGTVVLRRR